MIVNEIFVSIDGEVNTFHQGTMSTFIRLAGCNMRCPYCDTKYAQDPRAGSKYSIDELIKEIQEIDCKKITITGGEPLMQETELRALLRKLLYDGYKITVETNGSYDLSCMPWNENFGLIIDYKLWCPDKMIESNFVTATETDWIKFVLQNREEYRLAKEKVIKFRKKGCIAKMAFGVISDNNDFNISHLINLLICDKFFEVTVNFQLHKIINKLHLNYFTKIQ